jgi:phage terminase small subunit
MARALTSKQVAFICAYLQGGEATAAYKATYEADGMSPGALKVEACRLLANKRVASRLAELRREAVAQAGLLAARPEAEATPEPPRASPDNVLEQEAQTNPPINGDDVAPDGDDPNRPETTLTTLTEETTLTDPDAPARRATLVPAERMAVLNRAWVLARLMKNVQIAMGEATVKVRVVPKGASEPIEVEVTQRDASAANKALEMLGKTPEVGLFTGEPPEPGAGSAEPLTPTSEWLAKVRAQATTLVPVRAAPPLIEHEPAVPAREEDPQTDSARAETAQPPAPSAGPWPSWLPKPKE